MAFWLSVVMAIGGVPAQAFAEPGTWVPPTYTITYGDESGHTYSEEEITDNLRIRSKPVSEIAEYLTWPPGTCSAFPTVVPLAGCVNGVAWSGGNAYIDIGVGNPSTVTLPGYGRSIDSDTTTPDWKFTVTVNEQRSLKNAQVTAEDVAYTGQKADPAVSVTYGGTPLVEGVDYEVVVPEDAVDVGSYEVTVRPIEGSTTYKDEQTAAFNVTRVPVTVSGITANDKSYDGNEIATLDTTQAVFAGIADGDVLTVNVTGTFADAEPGEGKTVTFSPLTLGGEDAGNYYLVDGNQTTTKASITKKRVTVSGITAKDRAYSAGDTSAELDTSQARFDGLIGNDMLGVTGTGEFEDDAVGENKTVTIKDLALDPESARYELDADKSQKTTTASITALNDVAGASVTVGNYQYIGSQIRLGADKLTVKSGDKTLVAGTDYEVDPEGYGENRNVGTGTLTIKGKGGYVGTKDVEFNIIPRKVTVSGVKSGDKPYDGTSMAAINTEDAKIENIIATDEGKLTVTGTGYYADADGNETSQPNNTNVMYTLELAGDVAANYTLTNPEGVTAGKILPNEGAFEITVEDQVYTGQQIRPEGDAVVVKSGDKTLVAGTDYDITGYGNNVNVADGGTVTVMGKNGYQKSQEADFNILPLGVKVSGITAENKTYNAATNATLVFDDATLDGVIEADKGHVQVTAKGAFEDANAGDGKTVNISDLALTGDKAGNYALETEGQQDATTANITKRYVVVNGIKAEDKVYDGTTDASVVTKDATLDGKEQGDDLFVNATGSFESADPDDETPKTVTFSTLTLVGKDANNYTIDPDSETTTKAKIFKKEITVSGITAKDKVYDGNTDATLELDNLKIDGLVGNESVTLSGLTGAFENAEVGVNKTVNIDYAKAALDGTDKDHYKLNTDSSQKTTKATIYEKDAVPVIVKVRQVQNKVYDGNAYTNPEVTGLDVEGAEGVTATGTYVFVNETGNADPNVGTNKRVIVADVTLQVGDQDTTKYYVDYDNSVLETKASITPKEVKVTAKDKSKVFGTADPVLEVEEEGLIEGDTIAYNKYRDAGEDVGTYTIHLDGAERQGNYKVTYTDATFTITAAAVTVSGIKAEDRVYDGTTDVTFVYDDVVIAGIADGADVSVVAEGAFRWKNANPDKTANITKLTLTGKDAKNYSLALTGNQTSTTATVFPAPVTFSGVTAEGKTYDGTPDATLVLDDVKLEGVVAGEESQVKLDVSGSFVNKNVYRKDGEPSNKRIYLDLEGAALTGSGAKNYVLDTESSQKTTSAVISPKEVTVTGLKAENKPYDGNDKASIDVSGAKFANGDVVDGDDVEVESAEGKFADAEVGTGKAVSLTEGSIKLKGADAGNYVPDGDSYKVNPPLTADIIGVEYRLEIDDKTKVYAEDEPELTAQLKDKDGKPVTDVELSYALTREAGQDAGDYAITAEATGDAKTETIGGVKYLLQGGYTVAIVEGTLTIARAEVTVTAKDATKVYGDDDPAYEATVEGLIDPDTPDAIEYEFEREEGEDVGDYVLTATGNETQGNYKVTFNPTSGQEGGDAHLTITPRTVSVSGITAADKVYDRTKAVALDATKATIDNVAGRDEGKADQLAVAAEGEFETANAGTDVKVNLTKVELVGTNAKNYVLDAESSQASTTANIWRKDATVKPADASKTYGDFDPVFTAQVDGLILGDYVHYDLSRNAGEDAGTYDINATGEWMQGNYLVTFEKATFTINKKAVTVDGIKGVDKVYDATTDADLDTTEATVHDLAFDDELTVTATGKFEDKDVKLDEGKPAAKKVEIDNITLVGAKAKNYEMAAEGQQAEAAATITPAPLKVAGITASDKVYDGDAKATLDVTAATFETVFDGDEVSVESATGAFASKNVRRDANDNVLVKRVDISEVRLGGADKDNYAVEPAEGVQTTANAKITPKQVTVGGITAEDKDYDGEVAATLKFDEATFDGLIAADEGKVKVENAEGEFQSADAGKDKMVDIKTIVLGPAEGADEDVSGNYEPVAKDPHVSATIRALEVTVTADDKSKIYGEDDPELTATITPALAEGDTISYTLKRFMGEDAAEYEISFDNPQTTQGNYHVTYVPGTFTIKSRDITISAEEKTKVYGEDDPELTVEYKLNSEVKSGTTDALVGEDKIEYKIVRDAAGTPEGEEAEIYAIYFEGTDPEPTPLRESYQGGDNGKNYHITYVDSVLDVTSREITITANDKTKLYGEKDPEFTVEYSLDSKVESGSESPVLDGDAIEFEVSRNGDRGEEGGFEYTIAVTGEDQQRGHENGSARNYKVNFVDGTLSILRRKATVTADNADKVYGEKDPAFTATVDGTIKGDTLTYKFEREQGEDVGSYELKPVGEAIQGSYEVTYLPATLTITPKTVTVRPDNLSKTYGASDPVLTATVEGIVGSEKLEYTLTRKAGENVGTYEITATGAADQGNYLVEYAKGTFTINRRTVTVTAKNASKTYGQKDPEFTAKVKGLLNGDEVSYEFLRQSGEDAGKYAIVPSGKAIQGNYEINYVAGTLTIKPIKVTVTAKNASKYYGEKDPTLTAKVTGATKGESVTYTLKRAKGESTGTYTIVASGKEIQGNYQVTFKNGQFKIVDVKELAADYSAHVQTFGWTHTTKDGDYAGTTGLARRMEAITAKMVANPYAGGIQYRAHVQGTGWQGWKKDGAYAGTWGKSLRTEAIQMKLYGEVAKHYDVYYRVHVQGYGWMNWAKNGESAGSVGQSRRAEAFQMVILRKGSAAPKANFRGVPVTYGKSFVG